MKDATLAVLAGGAGSRMGGPKSLLTLAGRPILDHLIAQIAWPGPTLLVTSPACVQPPGARAFDREVTDPVAGEGPLRGVLTALSSATTPLTICVTVDMPCIGNAQVRWMAEAIAARPHTRGLLTRRMVEGLQTIEVFPCAFRPTAAALIAESLADQRRSMHRLLAHDNFETAEAPADWPEATWTNLNSPIDLASFEKGHC